MYSLIQRLFPICRSITGNGVRETLQILTDFIPLKLTEIPSGTKVFDWTVPDEWNIRDAYIKNSRGERVIDFKKSNLHVVGYSIPVKVRMTLAELKLHLHTLPQQPDLIPYVTSYYNKTWGFCCTHNQLESLKEDTYEVFIDSTLQPGALTFGELIIPGKVDDEIFFSTYICHPSLANNELSGPVVTTFLAQQILQREKPYYTYRFVFIPETIGAITYLSLYAQELKKKVVAGYVVTCIGDPGPFSYLQSRKGNTLVDRITQHVLKHSGEPFHVYDFLSRQSDERQYCAPNIDLPMGSLMRTRYGAYPEYHTSGDNLEFVTPEALADSLKMYLRCVSALENNHRYMATVLCEPQMGRRGLYPNLSKKGSSEETQTLMDILAYADDQNDLLWLAEKLGKSIETLIPLAAKLLEHDLIKVIHG